MIETTADSQTSAGQDMVGQSDTAATGSRSRRRAAGHDRRHVRPGRPRQVKIRYTDDEYTDVADAARLAGLTPTGYAGEAALAAARHAAPPSTAPWRQALLELMAARGQVRRLGGNVNQAARALNALGETPEWLGRAVAVTERAVTRLDEAAATLALVGRADRTGAGRLAVTVSGGQDGHDGQASDAHQSTCLMVSQSTANGAHTVSDHQDSQPAHSRRHRPVDRATQEGAA